MRVKVRRKALTATLTVMLVLLAALPLLYPYISSIIPQKYTTETNSHDFSSIQKLPLSPSSLLGLANVALAPVLAENFTQAEIALGYVRYLPPNTEHNLETYLTQLGELVSIMKSSKDDLIALKSLVENGQTTSARQLISQIDSLLSDASSRLELLNSALDRVAALYQIDVSTQRGLLEGLASTLTQFRQVLDLLETTLSAFDKRIATSLTVNASPNPVWINGTLSITGMLQSKGEPLGNRTVEIWINGIRLTEVRLDPSGRFEWKYSANGKRFDALQLAARYVPVGKDANSYRPTISATITIDVDYYPVVLTATQSTSNVHVLETFSIRGNLTNRIQQPLGNQRVLLLIDGKPANSSQTDMTGAYVVTASFPIGSLEGNHTLQVDFSPQQGAYASTRSYELGMQLYYIQSSVNLTSRGLGVALSGQTVSLTGVVMVNAKTFHEGSIIALLGGRELGRAPVGIGGIFTIPLTIPIEVSGLSVITIVFSPESPWIVNNTTTVQLNIINSGLISLGSVAFVAAAVTLSTQTVRVPSSKTKQRAREEIALQRIKPEIILHSPTIHLARLSEIRDSRLRVKETYWETRRMLAEVLNEKELQSETPRELATRLNPSLGDAATAFSLLTLLFEAAEYSAHEIIGDDCLTYALQVAAGVKVHVRLNETWPNLRDDWEREANSALRQLGTSTLKLTITPESVSAQLPWWQFEKDRALVRGTLEDQFRMSVDLIPVRYCDRCQYRLEGSAVELPVCPECGRRFEAAAS